jgi:site-specific recombinase XerD
MAPSFMMLMMTKGISIESVSSMLGHKNIRTTQHYSKIIKEKLSEEMKKLKEKLN